MSTGSQSEDGETRPSAGQGTPPAIPEHQLLRIIGSGSYGEVWLARCELGQFRAVKIVRRSFLQRHPGAYDREFAGIQRYEPMSRKHEGLVQLLQFGRGGSGDTEFFYYVMELADDANDEHVGQGDSMPDETDRRMTGYTPRTLARDIRFRAPFPFDEVITLGVQLAEALSFLHAQGLVHRDIKPSNIIFVGGRPKFADVGCVAELDNSLSAAGTVGYMPNEGTSTVAADIFSVGKVLYETATGKDRQDFPDLPSELLEQEDSGIAELNEVWVKACANNPTERYASATRLLSDLNQLQQGKSLRAARLRRRHLSLVLGALAVVLAVGAIAVGARALRSGTTAGSKEIFTDDFAGHRLDTNLWSWATKEWPGLGNTGHRQFRVEQTDHQLAIEARAEHEGGLSTFAAAWMDTRQDLRKHGDCRIEIELSGRNRWGVSVLSISDGQVPSDHEDSRAVRLLAMPGKHDSAPRDEASPLVHERVRIDLLPSHQSVIVYPDARITEHYDIIDLHQLSQWRLRFYAKAESSDGQSGAMAQFKIHRISAIAQPVANIITGHVMEYRTRRPIAGAIVKDAAGNRLAKTLDNGGFKMTAEVWPARIRVEHPDFVHSDENIISDASRLQGPVTVELRKQSFAFGEVVDVIPYTNKNTPTIGFWKTNLYALVNEGEGLAAESRLRQVDVHAQCLSAPDSRFPTGAHPLGFFVECGGLLVATMAHPGGIYDLADGNRELILSPETSGGRPIDWPYGCAFDGEFFWFVERDDIKREYALHAVDLAGRKIKHSIPSSGSKPMGLAWDGDRRQFWVSDRDKGLVYAVNRDVALREGKLETARGREFRGDYMSLAFGGGYLWGLDPDGKQICKIKVTDSIGSQGK